MRKTILALLIIVFVSMNLAAQDGYYEGNYNDEENIEALNYTTSVGAQLIWGGGFSWTPSKIGNNSPVCFNNLPDITAVGYLPLSSQIKLGVLGEIGLHSTSYANALETNPENPTITQIKYFIFGASAFYNGIYAGLNYGFPISGKRSDNNTSSPLAAESFVSLLDFKLGYNYPIWEDPAKGRLNLVAQIDFTMKGLMLTDIVDETDIYHIKRYNYQPLQFKIGLNYLFNMTGFTSY
ncbi:MAG: hypothetical protein WCR42_09190 [bacterium]